MCSSETSVRHRPQVHTSLQPRTSLILSSPWVPQISVIKNILRKGSSLLSLELIDWTHYVFSLHRVVALEIRWSAGKSPLIPLERQAWSPRVTDKNRSEHGGKALRDRILTQATDATTVGSFILNYLEQISIMTCRRVLLFLGLEQYSNAICGVRSSA